MDSGPWDYETHALCARVAHVAKALTQHFIFQATEQEQGKSKHPILENGLDSPKYRYGRYDFLSCYNISLSTIGVDGAFASEDLDSVVVDISQLPARWLF